jgi:hypothetical protein
MKKYILLIILFVPVSVFAREVDPMQIFVNFGYGANFHDSKNMSGSAVGIAVESDSSLWGDSKQESTYTYNFGVGFNYFFSDYFSIVTGLYYEQKILDITYPKRTAIDDINAKYTFGFATIPIGVRYNYNWFFIGGGLYVAIDDKVEVQVKHTTTLGQYTENYDRSSNNDFGLFVDLGVYFLIADKIGLTAFIRYEHGFSKVYDKPNVVVTDIQTRTAYLNIGVSYSL